MGKMCQIFLIFALTCWSGGDDDYDDDDDGDDSEIFWSFIISFPWNALSYLRYILWPKYVPNID